MFEEGNKNQLYRSEEKHKGLYYRFSNYFLDDKVNLKDIMQQLGSLADDEERIKEELFMLLSFFIKTFYDRQEKIRNIIIKNRDNLVSITEDMKRTAEEDDVKVMMELLIDRLRKLE